MMSLILSKSSTNIEKEIVDKLRDKKIVIFPCDTIYGLHGIVPCTDSLIRKIKGRNETKPFIQLFSKKLLQEKDIDKNLLSYWPNPLTIIVNLDGVSTAIRVPNDPLIISVIDCLKKPLFSSSVNKSGEPFLTSSKDIIKEYENTVDLIVIDEDEKDGLPSTIIDAREKPYKIIRQGAYDATCLVNSSLS